MRRIVITQNITLDGVVDAEQSWFDVTADTEQGRELAAVTAEHAAASDGFLVGRTTFEAMRGFWPRQLDDRTGVTDHLNRVRKYVVSTTLDDPGWDGTTVLRGGDALEPEIRALTDGDGTDIVLTGSITLGHSLLRAGLVHEVRLFTYPIVLGRGRRLFPDGWRAENLSLIEQRTFSGGVTLTRYAL
ncbi:dihydrofolate reductase family protein [Streptosporangium sp. NPDC023615]|uniref:dihydrofolate reductase family protein n=1 Tax=Streptosporangium sp. NPDC023615 TaxID=3154794 RepID=UPI00343A77E1